MVAEILCVGTELLLGQIVNTDAHFLSRKLSDMGIELYRIQTVGDNPGRVIEAINAAIGRCDLLITTGGLGPTDDDLTKEMVARTFGLPMELHQPSMDRLEEMFAAWGREMTPNNRKQAYFPKGAHILPNARGTAPGCIVDQDGKLIVVLPGPPYELTDMFEKQVRPYLHASAGYKIESRFVHMIGIGESDLETEIKDLLDAQTNPTLALYCSLGEVQVRMTVKCGSDEDAAKYFDPLEQELRRRLGNKVYAIGETDMPHTVAKLLHGTGLTLALAESCTGGMIADELVAVPGISESLIEGHVTYSNAAKVRVLGVKQETLDRYDAVSSQTAREMADGLHNISGADYCLSVTGIAGPDGGTPERPVGLVYVGLRSPKGTEVLELHLTGDRERIRTIAALRALDLLRRTLEVDLNKHV